MRVFYSFLLVLGLGVLCEVTCEKFPYNVGYYDQYIDHFNQVGNGEKTFRQKYLYQDKYWNPKSGPIFFYAGNEGPIEGFWDASGFIHQIAPEFQAYVVFPEHRYYGASLPFGNKSFVQPNLGQLTIAQALSDYALFLSDLKVNLNATHSRVIAFGGSYGGMLAAYMRFKYPNIVYGSLAASAPLFMQDVNGPRDFFFQLVTKDFYDESPTCVETIKQAFIEMDALARQGQSGLDQLSSNFNLCNQLQNQSDYRHLQGWVRNAFTIMAMMDYPYSADLIGSLPGFPVKKACEKLNMTSSSTTVMEGLREAAGILYNTSVKCFDIKAEFIECADPTGCGTGPDAIAWDYQACTDIWLPSGSNNVTDMFPVLPWNAALRHDYCLKTYGVVPRQRVPGIEFWGKNIKTATNIIFSNGDLDPWRGGGIMKDLSETLKAMLVVGGAHHLDLRAENKLDPPGVIKVRELERAVIRNWINEA